MIKFKPLKFDMLIFYAAIITSILSFSASETLSSICSILMYVLWACYAIQLFASSKPVCTRFVFYMCGVYLFQKFFFYIMYLVGMYPSSGSGSSSFLLYCVIFYVIGYNLELEENEKYLKQIIMTFFLGWMGIAITTVFEINWSSYLYYTFSAKNQMSQMIGLAAIFGVYIIPRLTEKILLKGVSILCGLGCLALAMSLHSRTPVLAFVIISIILFFSEKNKGKKDYGFALLVLVVVILLIQVLGGTDFIWDLINASGDSDATLDSVSSGRISIWIGAIEDFLYSPIIGIGAYAYIDNFILCVLRTGGLFSAVLLFPIAYGKTYALLKKSSKLMIRTENDIVYVFALVMKCMIIYYWIVSLFEGYPPFGPGTSTFVLWIMLGAMERMKLL